LEENNAPILLIDVSKFGSVAGCAEVVFEGNETVLIGLSGSHPRLWLPIPVLVNQFLSPYFLIIFHFYNLVILYPEYEGSMMSSNMATWCHNPDYNMNLHHVKGEMLS
jgi:hypothetical protein